MRQGHLIWTNAPHKSGAAVSGSSSGGIIVTCSAGLTMNSNQGVNHTQSILRQRKKVNSRWNVPGTFCLRLDLLKQLQRIYPARDSEPTAPAFF
jgi:hypothetical protein